MKVVCPSCERLFDLEVFRVEGVGLVIPCPKCGFEGRAGPPEAGYRGSSPSALTMLAMQVAPNPPPVVIPMISSPTPAPGRMALVSSPDASNVVKLRTSQQLAIDSAADAAGKPFEIPEGHCPKCLTKRQATRESCVACGLIFANHNPVTLEPPEWLSTQFHELLANWGDDVRHAKLRNRANDQEELPALARLYRIRLAHVPDDPVALRAREEMVRLASAAVSVSQVKRPEPVDRSNAWKLGLALMLMVLLAVGFLSFARVFFAVPR